MRGFAVRKAMIKITIIGLGVVTLSVGSGIGLSSLQDDIEASPVIAAAPSSIDVAQVSGPISASFARPPSYQNMSASPVDVPAELNATPGSQPEPEEALASLSQPKSRPSPKPETIEKKQAGPLATPPQQSLSIPDPEIIESGSEVSWFIGVYR